MCVCVYAHTHTYVHIHIHIHIHHMCTYTSIYLHMYTYIAAAHKSYYKKSRIMQSVNQARPGVSPQAFYLVGPLLLPPEGNLRPGFRLMFSPVMFSLGFRLPKP